MEKTSNESFFRTLRNRLLVSERQARFEAELRAHAEDAQSTKILGEPKELARLYNRSTFSTKKIALLCAFFVISNVSLWAFLNIDETPLEQTAWAYPAFLGFFLYLPLAPLWLSLAVFPLMGLSWSPEMEAQVIHFTFAIAPLVLSSVYVWMILYLPTTLRAIFKRAS